MMTAAERQRMQTRITDTRRQPQKRRNLPDLAARLAVLEADAPLASRDRLRRLRQRWEQLEGTRAQNWTKEWATEFDNVALALAREEVAS